MSEMSNTADLTATVPQAEPFEAQIAQLRRWLEGYIDPEGRRHAGLIEMVGELYGELKTRRERREAFARVVAGGGVLAMIGVILGWLKDHLR